MRQRKKKRKGLLLPVRSPENETIHSFAQAELLGDPSSTRFTAVTR